jgi:hypothetical protein
MTMNDISYMGQRHLIVRVVALFSVALTAVVLSGCASSATSSGSSATSPSATKTIVSAPVAAVKPLFFNSSSPFNKAVPSTAKAAANSAAVIAGLLTKTPVANLVHYGIPIYTATTSTPRVAITCTAPSSWGKCPLAGLKVPLSVKYTPNSGSDGVLVVLDRTADKAYELWRASRSGSTWTTEWGGVSNLKGSGWNGVATATGASRIGGVVLLSELKKGVIPHALAVQSSQTCASTYLSPANKTDGTSTSASCIPEGAHIQLSPSVNVKKLGLGKVNLAVATALQKYGAYVVDTGGSSLSISFQRSPGTSANYAGSSYVALGIKADYYAFSRIPWTKMRVLAK